MKKVGFYTLGCKVNQYETQALKEQFLQQGYATLDEDDEPCDVYIINSCTVTASADRKSRQAVGRLRRKNPDAVIVLCGCMPQAYPEEAGELAGVDLIMGTADRSKILTQVEELFEKRERTVSVSPTPKEFEPMRISDFDEHTRAFVKIEDGCDRFCSYCIIPTSRGRVRSKPIQEMTEELRRLAGNGYREIVLTGINLSSYGKDTGERLSDAVVAASKVPGIERIRLGSLEPDLITKEDLKILSQVEAFCPSFHLSLQSGCDATLKRMRRHYDTALYRKLVEDIRAVFENPSVTTDIMVGFPGETEEEFRESLAFAKSLFLLKAHVFPFSPRKGTKAAEMEDQVPQALKEARSRIMIEELDAVRSEVLCPQIGTTAQVLFESKNRDGWWEGLSKNYAPVKVFSDKPLSSLIKNVTIKAIDGDFCIGQIEEGKEAL